jgi:hypothetical protein
MGYYFMVNIYDTILEINFNLLQFNININNN